MEDRNRLSIRVNVPRESEKNQKKRTKTMTLNSKDFSMVVSADLRPPRSVPGSPAVKLEFGGVLLKCYLHNEVQPQRFASNASPGISVTALRISTDYSEFSGRRDLACTLATLTTNPTHRG